VSATGRQKHVGKEKKKTAFQKGGRFNRKLTRKVPNDGKEKRRTRLKGDKWRENARGSGNATREKQKPLRGDEDTAARRWTNLLRDARVKPGTGKNGSRQK